MKIGEFLSKSYKDEIPFLLYHGNGKGYKISCLECDFFKPNEKEYGNVILCLLEDVEKSLKIG